MLAVLADNPRLDPAALSKAAGFHGFEKTARFLKQLHRDGLISQTPVPDHPAAPNRYSLTPRGYDVLNGLSPPAPPTSRIVLVLAAVSECAAHGSDASNMVIAKAAGIANAGQISKLLARLEGLDLLSRPPRPTASSPNQWSLTPRGRELLESSDSPPD